ncbi:T9SS type A sorting domain-containing protein [bacterium]|nr:T9SS type A sorting domain-containing protein [bacterium]
MKSRIGSPFIGSTGNAALSISSDVYALLAGTVLSAGQEESRTGSEEKEMAVKLLQNHPNPFNPHTTIKYFLPQSSRVVVKIYHILGIEICTLVDEEQDGGEKNVRWNAKNQNGEAVASGMYICRIIAGKYHASMKMILLK